MSRIVFCSTATSAEDAAREANATTCVRNFAPVADVEQGTVCDKDPTHKHWLLEHPDQETSP